MKSNRIGISLVASSLLFLSVNVSGQKISSCESLWHQGPAMIDDEAQINRMHYDDKSKFMFMITNNEEQLFIDLVLSDQAAIQKIMRFGLTTWLNRDGKTKKGTGIVFPRSPEETGEPVFRKEKGGDRKAMMMAMMENKNKEMELKGFYGKGVSTVIDLRKDTLYSGRVEMKEGGKLHISIVMPLAMLGRGEKASDFSAISIGFETGYMDVTGQGGGSGGSMQGSGGMHGSGMPGGGMPGGGPPPGGNPSGDKPSEGAQQQPDIAKLASPSKLWIKEMKLAENP
jgi:hypothetical protein